MTARSDAQTSAGAYKLVDLRDVYEHENVRASYDERALAELTESVKAHGVLQPIMVRPSGAGFEVVCGHRRRRAAAAAGLVEIPAIVRELDDQAVLEIQVIENLQRADLHPLDEAQGYNDLMRKHGYDAQRIADRLGRSVKYVYDRVKLLALIEPAQKVFLDGLITAGHAVILARLDAKDQARCLGSQEDHYTDGGLLREEHLLWGPNESDEDRVWTETVKPVSVRELQTWVDMHVRFEAETADPMLFPETDESLQTAREQAEKIVPITYDNYIQPEAREGRTFGPRSWKRADGDYKSKTCDQSITGVVVIGPERGQAFKVCIAKKRCKTHWGSEIRANAKRAKQGAAEKKPDKWERQRQRQRQREEAARERNQALRERWEKARPAVLEAIAAAVLQAPATPGGPLADILLSRLRRYGQKRSELTAVPPGKTAESLLRHLAYIAFRGAACGWHAHASFPKTAKSIGVDTKKILAAVAPPEKPKKKTTKRKPAKRKASKRKVTKSTQGPVKRKRKARPAK